MRGRLGPYEILSPLGSGGMGEVYRARDRRLDRIVAVKVLKASTLHRPLARARFDREARAVAQLDHPNICALYDIGHDEGVDFLVMQYLDGETLASRLQRGRLSLPEALRYASQITHAIAAAHRRGVTHRDLKPSNIMLVTGSGAAILLDFGLAKLTGQEPASDTPAETTTADLSGDGALLGTVRYMAPEVLDRRPADARSDLYSLGAVVYEMVTGRRPFDGDTEARVIAAIMTEEAPRLKELRPEAPVELESLIHTCLAKEPDQRWQDAHDVARQLDSIAGSLRLGTPAATVDAGARVKRAGRAWLQGAAVLSIGLAAALGVLMAGRPRTAAVPPPHVVALPCDDGPGPARALCDGLAESLIARLGGLTQTHPLQVTPQLGGIGNNVFTSDDAYRSLGATRILQGRTSRSPGAIDYTMAGARNQGVMGSYALAIADTGIFDAEERAIAWLIRALGLDLTHSERSTLVVRDTASTKARAKLLTGRGYLARPKEAGAADAAIAVLTSALADDPGYADAHVALGMAWRARYLRSRDGKDWSQAYAACAEAVRLKPNSSRGRTCLGMLLNASRKFEDAAAELVRALDADLTNDDAVVWLARTQEDLGSFVNAERSYLRAVERRPAYFTTHVWAANFYRRQARYEDAAAALARASALVPGNARLRASLAAPLIMLGRYHEAIAELEAAVAIEPTREALVSWGMTLLRMQRFEQAVTVMERARVLGGPDATATGGLARAYYWWGTADARARAAALFREALTLAERDLVQPSGRLPSADLHIAAADFCAKLGREDEARAHLQKVGLNADDPARPTDPHQLFFAALVYAQLDDRDTALKWLERAVYWGVPAAELRVWRELDRLRNDRAFQALTRPN